MTANASPPLSLAPRVLLMLAFVVSRVLYYQAGIRFDATPLFKYWQFIDPELMRSDLLRSMFYLHMQPPGYNLAVGLVLKLFPESYVRVFALAYLAIGLLIAIALFELMRRLGVGDWLAAAITALFTSSPGVVMYENFLIYEYPILLLLLAAALALFRLCRRPTSGYALLFFGLILALTLVRNAFHLLYLLVIAAGLAWALPGARRAVAVSALPVIGVDLAIYVKNWVLFGAFTSSTWGGMATGVTTTYQLTPQEADRLIAQHVVTPLARIEPFSPLSEYAAFVHMPPKTGIPVLDQEMTSSGHPNYNHLAYLQVHSLYVENSKAIWLHYPVAYVRSVVIAWFSYFLPTTDLHSFDPVRPRVASVERIFSVAFFGQFRHATSRKDLRAMRASGGTLSLVLYTGVFLIVIVPVLTVWGFVQVLRNRISPEKRVTVAFLIVTIIYLTLLSTMLSSFEGNRYRFPLDGYYLALLGTLLTALLDRRSKGGTHASSPKTRLIEDSVRGVDYRGHAVHRMDRAHPVQPEPKGCPWQQC